MERSVRVVCVFASTVSKYYLSEEGESGVLFPSVNWGF